MKKLLIVACSLVAVLAANAQGTVSFKNKNSATTPPIDARILMPDGITPANGANAQAALYAGPSATSLTLVGPVVGFGTTTAAAGYVAVGAASSRVIPGVNPGDNAFVQVRAWVAGATSYEDAISKGLAANGSNILSVKTGGAGSPPSLPGELIGLQGFTIPEPSTLALAGFGVAALLMRRRK